MKHSAVFGSTHISVQPGTWESKCAFTCLSCTGEYQAGDRCIPTFQQMTLQKYPACHATSSCRQQQLDCRCHDRESRLRRKQKCFSVMSRLRSHFCTVFHVLPCEKDAEPKGAHAWSMAGPTAPCTSTAVHIGVSSTGREWLESLQVPPSALP